MGPLRTNHETSLMSSIENTTFTPGNNALGLAKMIMSADKSTDTVPLNLGNVHDHFASIVKEISTLVKGGDKLSDTDATRMIAAIQASVEHPGNALSNMGEFEVCNPSSDEHAIMAHNMHRLVDSSLNSFLVAIKFDAETDTMSGVDSFHGLVLLALWLVGAIKSMPCGWLRGKGATGGYCIQQIINLLLKDSFFGSNTESDDLNNAKFVTGMILARNPDVAVVLNQWGGSAFMIDVFGMARTWADLNSDAELSSLFTDTLDGDFRHYCVSTLFHSIGSPKAKDAASGITKSSVAPLLALLESAGIQQGMGWGECWKALNTYLVASEIEPVEQGALVQVLLKIISAIRIPHPPTDIVTHIARDWHATGEIYTQAAKWGSDLPLFFQWAEDAFTEKKKDGSDPSVGFYKGNSAYVQPESERCAMVLRMVKAELGDTPLVELLGAAMECILSPGTKYDAFNPDSKRFEERTLPTKTEAAPTGSLVFFKTFVPIPVKKAPESGPVSALKRRKKAVEAGKKKRRTAQSPGGAAQTEVAVDEAVEEVVVEEVVVEEVMEDAAGAESTMQVEQ